MCLVPGALCGGERGKPLFYWGLVRVEAVTRGRVTLPKIFFWRGGGQRRSKGREAERGLGRPWGCPPRPRTTNRGRRHRACAIDESVVAAKLEGCAFSSRRRHSRHPAPGGVAPSPTSRKRAFRATRKLGKPHVEARKGFAEFSNTQEKIGKRRGKAHAEFSNVQVKTGERRMSRRLTRTETLQA